MDQEKENRIRNMLLLLDGGRLLSMGILQHKHRDIDELLADNQIHTKVRELRDSGRISDEHFHLLFPPTDLNQWDATITSRFLKHCTDIDEPQRKIMDELNELRIKAMEMYQKQEMSHEECKLEWEMIVGFLERGKTLLTGPIVVEINKTLIGIKEATVTNKDMARVNSWYDLGTKDKDSDTGNRDTTESKSVIHDAAFHGKLSTLKYMRKKFPGRLYELDKIGNQAVHFAAEGGHIDCLRYICESFPELIMVRNEMGCDALHCAANGGSLDCLKYLISQGMNTETRSKYGLTILHEAAYSGSVSIVQFIYETFRELIEERNEKGMDALFIAAREGRINCLKYLISQGMATDARSKNGDTLLHVAAYGGYVSMVIYIWETYPELRKETNEKGENPLHNAARGGSHDCLMYLISQCMETDTRSNDGNTLLHDAAYGGSMPTLQYMWETFPDLRKETNALGQDILSNAARGGSLDCLKYLIIQGVRPETRSNDGNTLLHEAAYGGSMSTLQYVWEIFPELRKETNERGQDILRNAARGGSLDCLKYLIRQGMKPETRSYDGNTLLHEAANGGSMSTLQYVWETFPDLRKETNDRGQDTLSKAAHGGSLDCLKYLIRQGIKPETRSNDGNTLLHEAAYGGSMSTLQYVWETFPELRKETNERGQDILSKAAHGESLDCLKYLIRQGMKPETRSNDGNTLLHEAAYGGSMSTLQYVWETFPELRKETNERGRDILSNAALGGSLDCLKYLIRQGMKPETPSNGGNTLLHEAAYGGSMSTLQYVWETFPELRKETNERGQDILSNAALGGSLDCLKYLIRQGMKPETPSNGGNTLLHEAAYGGSMSTLQYVWETFPELRKKTNARRQDILTSSARGGSLDCLKYLISQGMNTQSKNGPSILHQAAYCGHESVVRYLCENYFQLLSCKQTHGQTAIFEAVDGGHLYILQYLLSQRMDPKQSDKKGHTILHAAARNGRTDIVRYLCTHFKFLIPMKGFKGETARDIASRNRKLDCVQIMQERL